MVRRSGIANDIIVRGQKKDNINITIDGAKVCGACPNRMDPPISHILTNNIDYIEINEGPYNVEDFGVLSADVKIHTIKPKKEFTGDINLGYGSFNYQKGAFTMSGGSDNVRVLLSGSLESSEQYEDGDGDDFVEQIQREIDAKRVNTAMKNPQYQDKYKNLDAYTKNTLMAKLFWDITDNQELRLSYTANRSDDILYPSSKMDALYDDSDIYSFEYIIKDLSSYSKKLSFQAYQSEVEHPMSTKYRVMGAKSYMTHALSTKVQGLKLKNSYDLNSHTITAGLDYSLRNWDGAYYKDEKPMADKFFHSIYDVDTKNYALFLKDKIDLGSFEVEVGSRYDMTDISSKNAKQQDNDYDALNGYILATYSKDEFTNFFAGVGKSYRVPDAKELYWVGSPMKMKDGSMKAPTIGTPNLDATTNVEFDVGVEKEYENVIFKAKAFYSILGDFIAYNASKKANRYENVDASLYGVEVSGSAIATDWLYFDYGVAYQRGEKDNPLANQKGTNMPEIPPLKFNIASNFEFDNDLSLRAEIVGSDEWSDVDSENGEQKLDSYAVLNLKATQNIYKNFELTFGVDNVLDNTYAISNTYKDLILLPTTKDSEVMLMNEPGRYFYTNVRYKF